MKYLESVDMGAVTFSSLLRNESTGTMLLTVVRLHTDTLNSFASVVKMMPLLRELVTSTMSLMDDYSVLSQVPLLDTLEIGVKYYGVPCQSTTSQSLKEYLDRQTTITRLTMNWVGVIRPPQLTKILQTKTSITELDIWPDSEMPLMHSDIKSLSINETHSSAEEEEEEESSADNDYDEDDYYGYGRSRFNGTRHPHVGYNEDLDDLAEMLTEEAWEVRAPFGRGEETVLDTNVRKVWQIDPSSITIAPQWDKTIKDTLLPKVRKGLGLKASDAPIEASLYKMLIYDEGGFFLPHRDTEKVPRMFATLVVVLPCQHTGGRLLISHDGRNVDLNLENDTDDSINYASFYADCRHEVTKVEDGYRICLVYNVLRSPKRGRRDDDDSSPDGELMAGALPALVGRIADRLQNIFDIKGDMVPPLKIVYLLKHQYSQAELAFDTLKTTDKQAADLLKMAGRRFPCYVTLGIVEIEESGDADSPEETADTTVNLTNIVSAYACEIKEKYYDEDYDEDEDEEEDDEPVDSDDEFDNMSINPATEFFPSEALEDITPDDESIEMNTGNEGVPYERSYSHAAIAIWPRANKINLWFSCLSWTGVLGFVDERIRDSGGVARCKAFAFDLIYKMIDYYKRDGPGSDKVYPVYVVDELLALKGNEATLLIFKILEILSKTCPTGQGFFTQSVDKALPRLSDPMFDRFIIGIASNRDLKFEGVRSFYSWMAKSPRLASRATGFLTLVLHNMMTLRGKYGLRYYSSFNNMEATFPLWVLARREGVSKELLTRFSTWMCNDRHNFLSHEFCVQSLKIIKANLYEFPIQVFIDSLIRRADTGLAILDIAPFLSPQGINDILVKLASQGDLNNDGPYNLLAKIAAVPNIIPVAIVHTYAAALANRLNRSYGAMIPANRFATFWANSASLGINTAQQSLVKLLNNTADTQGVVNILMYLKQITSPQQWAKFSPSVWPVWVRVAKHYTALDQHAVVFRDWSMPINHSNVCACVECRALNHYLRDPAKTQFTLKAIKATRSHIEGILTYYYTYMHFETLAQGSPQSLIVQKNVEKNHYIESQYQVIHDNVVRLYQMTNNGQVVDPVVQKSQLE
eukprot:gene12970-15245_t